MTSILTISIYEDRLRTILSYDRIMVLDSGNIVVCAHLHSNMYTNRRSSAGIWHTTLAVSEGRRILPWSLWQEQHNRTRYSEGLDESLWFSDFWHTFCCEVVSCAAIKVYTNPFPWAPLGRVSITQLNNNTMHVKFYDDYQSSGTGRGTSTIGVRLKSIICE